MYCQYLLFRSTKEKLSFSRFFTEGFRTFIVITLLMVLFTWIFLYTHPEIREQMALQYRDDLVRSGNRTPMQIESQVAEAKKKYITFFTSVAIFGYLMIGALGSLIGALFFTAKMSSRMEDRSA
jgi:ABC-type Na+ efflux pump permease subunit